MGTVHLPDETTSYAVDKLHTCCCFIWSVDGKSYHFHHTVTISWKLEVCFLAKICIALSKASKFLAVYIYKYGMGSRSLAMELDLSRPKVFESVAPKKNHD